MTTTPTNTSNNALEYAVNNNIIKLAQWTLMKPESEKPTNIETCLNLAISKNVDKDIINLLVSEIKLPKTIVESQIVESQIVESQIVNSDIKNSKTEDPKTEESKTEESKTEESKIADPKTEESKIADPKTIEQNTEAPKIVTPNVHCVHIAPNLFLNGINLREIKISSLMYNLAIDPGQTRRDIINNVYSIEDLNYQIMYQYQPYIHGPKSYSGFTLLHMLCTGYESSYHVYYESILEYHLTKADIDINISDIRGYTPFQIATYCDVPRISDKIFRLFLDHPKFNHRLFDMGRTIMNQMKYFGNNQAIYLLLEHPSTFFLDSKESFMTSMLLYCCLNPIRNFQMFEKIMSNPKIEFKSYDWVFKGIENVLNTSNTSNENICTYFEIIAKSKRMGLDVWKDLKQNIANDNLKSQILKIYIKYYPDGIY
jgi:hypothetical protein